jgi:hypothetical protein
MRRRQFASSATALLIAPAWAHHGWSSFDQTRPIYLEGKARKVSWRNPHAELELEVPADLKLPADLAHRSVPAQSAPVDGPKLLAAAQVPKRKDKVWEIELAPLTRIEAWQLAEIKPGTEVSVLGFTFGDEKGEPVVRAEYIWVGGKAYGMRSSPA